MPLQPEINVDQMKSIVKDVRDFLCSECQQAAVNVRLISRVLSELNNCDYIVIVKMLYRDAY